MYYVTDVAFAAFITSASAALLNFFAATKSLNADKKLNKYIYIYVGGGGGGDHGVFIIRLTMYISVHSVLPSADESPPPPTPPILAVCSSSHLLELEPRPGLRLPGSTD